MTPVAKAPKTYQEALEMAHTYVDKVESIHFSGGSFVEGADLGLADREVFGEKGKEAERLRMKFLNCLVKHSNDERLEGTASGVFSKGLLQETAERAALQNWSKLSDIAALREFFQYKVGNYFENKEKY